jgi:hypothetical protein
MADKRKTLAAVGAGGCIFGLAAWLFYFRIFAGERGEDWMVYYSAARSFFDDHLATLYHGATLTAAMNARFAGWLAHPLPLHPFLYPPHYLLLLLPFGAMPPALGAVVFLLASFALMAAALILLSEKRDERLLYVLAALLSPAAAIAVWLGQNSFLTAALLVGGFALAKRRPLLAGILLGVLTYKPQFWLMVPIALIAARQWKTLGAALGSAALLALTSLVVFGPAPWEDWLSLMTAPSALFEHWQTLARLNGQSLYACAVLLGASPQLANALQFTGAALAGAAVWRCFSRPFPADLAIAILLAATVFAAPHIIDYDALLLCIAAAIFFAHTLRHGADLGDSVIAVALWLSPLINPPSVFPAGLATPLLVALFVLRVVRRAAPPLQSPAFRAA